MGVISKLTELRALLEQYEAAAWSEGLNEARANDSQTPELDRQYRTAMRADRKERLQFEREIIKFFKAETATKQILCKTYEAGHERCCEQCDNLESVLYRYPGQPASAGWCADCFMSDMFMEGLTKVKA